MMKKYLFTFLVVFSIILLVPILACADTSNDELVKDIYENTKIIELENESTTPLSQYFKGDSILENVKLLLNGESPLNIKEFFNALVEEFKADLLGDVGIIGSVLCLCILSSLLKNLFSSFLKSEIETIASLAIYVSLAAVLSKVFFENCAMCVTYITSLTKYTNVLISAMFSILIFSGGITSGGALSPIMLLIIDLLSNLISSIIIPVLSFSFIVMIIDSIFTQIDISEFAKFLKSTCLFILGGAFVIVLSVCSAGALTFSGVDSLFIKTSKYALNSFVPIIGRFLSESATTLFALLGAFSSAVGFIGTFSLVAISAAPLLKMGVFALVFKFAGFIVQPVADTKFSKAVIKSSEYISLIFWCSVVVLFTFLMMVAISAVLAKWVIGNSGV